MSSPRLRTLMAASHGRVEFLHSQPDANSQQLSRLQDNLFNGYAVAIGTGRLRLVENPWQARRLGSGQRFGGFLSRLVELCSDICRI